MIVEVLATAHARFMTLGWLLAFTGVVEAQVEDRGHVVSPDAGVDATGPTFVRPTRDEDVVQIILNGRVFDDAGLPASGALIGSSAGGTTITDQAGEFSLMVQIPRNAPEVQVTAVRGRGASAQSATVQVPVSRHARALSVGTLTLASGTMSRGTNCQLEWLPSFGGANGFNSTVRCSAVFDDGSGSGPELFVGGYFTYVGETPVTRIAKWNGSQWAPVGGGLTGDDLNESAFAMAVHDDGLGGGPALYVAGSFESAGGILVNRIAKWDGVNWSALGNGASSQSVSALASFDDGTGPALYMNGTFSTAGSTTGGGVAKWNGTAWSSVRLGFTGGGVSCFAVFDDGSGGGAKLYAGGTMSHSGTTPLNRIARWSGTSWDPVGGGLNGPVTALAVSSGGLSGGPALYVAGNFTTAAGGSLSARSVARWHNNAWSALSTGIFGSPPMAVYSLAVVNIGGVESLYAGGYFTNAGGLLASNIARWNGSAWSALAGGMNGGVHTFTVYDEGHGPGPQLFAGGEFWNAGGALVQGIARWDGGEWSRLAGQQATAPVRALVEHDDGSGLALYAGGEFPPGSVAPASYISRWNGSAWSALGSGMNGTVHALLAHDDGSGGGSQLFAGGSFTAAGGQSANGIARWNGAGWSALGSGVNQTVLALCEFDDGNGAALYAGGSFVTASANRVAKWNGSSWSSLGSGVNGTVQALAVHDDGSGPALYAGGTFTTAGTANASRIAKWDGATWSALSTGVDGPVWSLTSFEEASGARLIAGGLFANAGTTATSNIARWDGAGWSAMGSGMDDTVRTLHVFDAGLGSAPQLYAGGLFWNAGGVLVSRIARWTGTTWEPLADGRFGPVLALTTFHDPHSGWQGLFVGGQFVYTTMIDNYLARWGLDPQCVLSPVSYCTPKMNSLGCVPQIGSSGFASSSSTSGFLVVCGNALNNKPGLILYGVNGPASLPFQAGFLCVNPPIRRSIAANSGGSPPPAQDCSGAFSLDMNAFAHGLLGGSPHALLLSVGSVVHCQWWGRDPGFPAPNNTQLSEGLEYVVGY